MTKEQKDLVRHMLSELENPRKRLSPWEEGFISDVADQFDRSGYLSDPQREKLEQIYSDKT